MTAEFGIKHLITDALIRDRGELGDVTTMAVIERGTQARAELIVKADRGIVSGLEIAREVLATADENLAMTIEVPDGEKVIGGDVVAVIEGPARSLLTSERVVLEFVRRMSGIATRTAEFVKEVEGTGVSILDTRKTLPGYLGELDKRAVKDGGGVNHRKNLSEMGLIKNNHIDLAGGISSAVAKFREAYPAIDLEVEVRDQQELIEALIACPERIMLDNMTTEQIKEAVEIRDEYARTAGVKIPLEASGNMVLERVREVALTGVEFISVGELTHSVKALDISLHISNQNK